MASANGLSVPVLEAVLPSNRHHRGWAMRELSDRLGDVHGKRVAVLGLAYKPGTSTVRRSTAVELCRWLQSRGAVVVAYDPAVQELPNGLADIERADSLQATIDEADAAVVATEWQEIKDLSDQVIAARMRRPLVIDPGRFLIDALGSSETTEYVTIGIPS
jgi:UDPglucose 6-dehydrogenase